MSTLSKTVRGDLPLHSISTAAPAEKKVIRNSDGSANNRPIPSFWNFDEDDHVLTRPHAIEQRSTVS